MDWGASMPSFTMGRQPLACLIAVTTTVTSGPIRIACPW
jgi:hypothetical protein